MFSLLAKGESEEHIIMKLVYHSPKNEKLENWKEKLFHNSFASRFQGSQRKQKRRENLIFENAFGFFPL